MICCRLHSLKVVCQRQEVNSRPSNLSVHVSPSRHTPRGRCCVRAKGVQGGLYLKKKKKHPDWHMEHRPAQEAWTLGSQVFSSPHRGRDASFSFLISPHFQYAPMCSFQSDFHCGKRRWKGVTWLKHCIPLGITQAFLETCISMISRTSVFKGSKVQIRWSGMDLPSSKLLPNQHLTFRGVTFSFWVSVSENH